MAIRIMGDSTTVGDVPHNVDIVAFYDDGHLGVPSPGQANALYPHEKFGHCWIDVNGSRPDSDVRDWETGDKAGSLEQWVIEHNKIKGKKDAVVYCNRATIPEVRNLTGSQILGKDYYLFIATLDGEVYRAPGVIACQDKGEKQTGRHYDSTQVFDDRFWQKLAPPPQPVPDPGPTPKPTTKPNCKPFQNALHVPVIDGLWGPVTDKHAGALIHASSHEFPYSVQFAQRVVGTNRDGQWGPQSEQMLRHTISAVQNALRGMGFKPGITDGIWGPKTDAAYKAARQVCHI